MSVQQITIFLNLHCSNLPAPFTRFPRNEQLYQCHRWILFYCFSSYTVLSVRIKQCFCNTDGSAYLGSLACEISSMRLENRKCPLKQNNAVTVIVAGIIRALADFKTVSMCLKGLG